MEEPPELVMPIGEPAEPELMGDVFVEPPPQPLPHVPLESDEVARVVDHISNAAQFAIYHK